MNDRAGALGLSQLRQSRLVRQNVVLFAGGLIAGVGGFVYHAVAGRILGPALYDEVATLIALYAVLMTPTYILMIVLGRYSATLTAEGNQGAIRHIMVRASRLMAVPSVVAILVTAVLARPAAGFLHFGSAVPLVWLGVAVAVVWQLAVPRGVLQGVQRFSALSANLSVEMVVRTAVLYVLLMAGLSVTGSMVAVLAGVAFTYGLGMVSLRDVLRLPGSRVPLRAMAGFSATAAAGTLGILLLYNLDVILSTHFLPKHEAGIYAGLNKIGTIIYFLTVSVSQVLFPRVVEAIAQNHHPGRLLLMSAGIMALLGAGAIAVFGLAPALVVDKLFGSSFQDAVPFVLPVGFIGLALSLDNLLVQFFMAAHDRVFVPLLAAACVLQPVLIVTFHSGVRAIVLDELVALLVLLAVLSGRCLLILPGLGRGSAPGRL
ncbi:MAG: lipopolysaccharide biosynthesis protein [Candidatus Dormibacterales bacterium]